MRKAPRARHRLDHPTEPTPAMTFGTAAPAAVLAAGLFAATCNLARHCEFNTAGCTRCRNGARPTFADVANVLAADNAVTLDPVRQAVARHPVTGPLLALRRPAELSIL